MARKARDLDQKLLEVGKQLLIKNGFGRFSLREVAKSAKINLGMFAYYFKGKNDFLNAVLDQIYAPFIEELKSPEGNKLNLETVLFKMAKFSRDHADIVSIIIPEVLTSDSVLINFLSKHFTKHFDVLKKALQIHFEDNNLDTQHFDHALRFLIASIGIPNLMVQIRNKNIKIKREKDSDEDLKRRVKAVLKGLKVIAGK